jgi:gliding motility-associated-like protein
MRVLTSLSALIISVICGISAFGQTINGGGGAIPDNSATTTCFQVNVTGIGTIDGAFGLEQVCINITHTWDSDLDIYLEAPDGTIVPLTSDNGGSGDNYTNTCFTMTAGTSIVGGTAPFNGTYLPEGDLGLVNNGQNANGTWSLCITDDAGGDVGTLNSWNITFGNNPANPPVPPANDDPCNATPLATTVTCTYATGYTTFGATSSSGVPAPGCGNYAGGDVWFSATVPASGNIQVDTDSGTMLNGDVAIYTGSCGSLSLLDCDDQQSGNTNMGLITATGLTPGQTVYIRVWSNGNLDAGTFGICVTDPPTPPDCGGNPAAGNTCANAPNICDLDGICGSTSSSYSADYWAQLNTAFCGSIENNSFVAFTSDGNDLNLNVFVQNCAGGATDAVQFMVFQNSGCSGNVTEIECQSPMYQSDSPVTFSATGLTAGQTYYLMIDGWAGDVCDYAISANSGVEIPVDAGTDVTICEGESTTLTAQFGDGINYTWNNGAGTGANPTVSPTTTTTYTVSSPNGNPLCGGGTTTDQVTVTVEPNVPAGIDANSALTGNVGPSYGDPNSGNTVQICSGGSATLTASGAGTPVWSPATGLSSTTAGTVTANPTATTVYTLTMTTATGCVTTATITVDVAPAPTVTVNSGTICEGDNMVLTATGMTNYTWSPATGLSATSGASVTASPTATTTYTVTGSTTGCPNDTETSTVTVTPLPNPNFSITGSQCLSTNSITVTNTGTAGTYAWTFAGGTPATATGSPATTSFATAGSHNITLTTTTSGCTDAVTIPVTINPDPTVTVTPTDVSCNGDCDGSVTAVGAGTSGYNYNWGAAGTGATITGQCVGTYNVTVTDINGCQVTGSGTINEPPVLAITATATDVSCAGLTDGTVTANNATGGTAPYTYSWSGGLGTNQNVTGVAAGTYTVTVTDAENCTETATVTINEPAAIVVTATSADASCGSSDGSVSVTSTTGGSGTYVSTVWEDASSNPVADPNNVPAGSYTVTVTDNQGCTGTATVSVGNLAGPVVSLVAQTNASCSMVDDGTASVSVTGGAGSPTYTWTPAPGGGQGTTAVTGLVGGTAYTVTVDDAGCTDVLVINIGTDPDPTAATVLDSDVLCPGDCNGQATATMTGGTGPFTYAWDNAETSQQATALCVGTSNVTITDSDGCTATASVTVNAPNPLTVTIAGTDATCNGGTDGSADVTITDGTAPYTTVWTHGPTAEDLTGVLAAGTYTIDVTDNNGCQVSVSVTIGEPTPIVINPITATDVQCNGGSDGEVDATATGGTGVLSYEWFDATPASVGTGANVTGLPIGTYDVVVTDANSCTETASVTVNEPTAIALTPGTVNSNCGQADGEVSVTATGGTVAGAYTYLWQDAATTTVGTTATVTGLVAGTYTVTVTDDNGCTETATATISDAGAPSLSETHIDAFCNGSFDGSIDITTAGGTAPFTFAWAGPNGFTSTNQDINLLEAGQYDITATDNNGCIATLSITINEPPVVTVTPTSVDATCNGGATGSVDATSGGGTGAITYEWFDDALLSNSIGTGSAQTGLAAGTYYVEATDANGCTADASIVVGEPNAIVVSTGATDANCGLSDGTVFVTGNTGGSGTYVSETWVDNLGNPVADINAVPSGSYTVTVTDDQGCTGTAVQGVNDLVGPTLNLLSAASASCAGYCDGTAIIEAVGGTPTYVYTWNPAPGGGQGTPSVTGLCAGDYNVSVSDDNGCTDNIIVTILEPTPLVASIVANTDVTINGAADGTATASASGGTPAYTYEWFNGCPPGTTTGQTAIGATGLAAGDYSVVIQDSKGCLDTACTTINEPTTITIVETITDVTCFNGTDGEISILASGGVPGYTYEWFDATTSTTTGQTGITATGLAAGDYYVVVQDQNGATQTSPTYTVGEPTQVVLTTSVTSDYNGADISCFGACDGAADVTAVGGTTPYSYAWDAAAGSQTTAAINGLCAGTYSVDVTDNNGCVSTETVTVTEPTQLTNTPTQTDASCNGVCDGVANTSAAGGTGAYAYQWNDPGLSTTPSISNLCAGTYDVTITDANNCTINESYTITEPTALVLGETTTGSNCNQNDGDATVTIASGDAPFTYLWDANAGNQTTATASNLFAGCYDVDVTDANGCVETLNICVQDLGAPTVTILTQTDVSCNGGADGFAQIQVTDGTAPYTYDWEDCSGNSIGQTTASALNLAAGCYTGTMVDNVGCQASISVTINEPTALNAAITASADVTCFGYTDGSATVTAGGGTPPYTYLWNDGGNQTTATATNLAPGTYQVTVTDDNSCTITADVTINEPAEIQLSTTVVDAFCATGTGSATVTVTAAGVAPFTYNWTPTSQATDVATGLTPGVYDVTVTDNDGCIQTAQATVGDIPAGTATIGTITDVTCNAGTDGTIDVSMSGTGTAPYTYQWYNATTGTAITGQTNQQATGLPAGDYYVEVTDVNGCFSTSNTGTIAEPTAVQVTTAVTDALCNGSCDGTAEAIAVGGTQPYTYSWNDPLNQTSVTAGTLCAGSYDVVVTDNNGCTGTASGTIAEPTLITIDSTVTNANCQQADGSACVIPAGGTGTYTYLWPDGSTNSCAGNLAASTYVVSVFDQNNCQQQISVEVSDLGGPVADITNFTLVSCNGFTDGQATVDMTSGNGTTFTVLWDVNAGSQTTPTASNLGAGTYGVTITDDLGCNASTSVTITEPDVLAYNINTFDATCFSYCDGSADITVIGGTLPYTYQWLDNANNPIGTGGTSLPNLCTDNYGISVVDGNGCTFTDNFTILDPVEVTGSIVGQDISCFNACDGQANATGVDGFAPFTFQWDAAAGNQTGNLAQNLCPGTYVVTITDDNGCIGSESVTITEPTLLTSSIDQSANISCNGFCDGFAQGSAAGGTAPYIYSWSGGAGNNTLAQNLCAGTYTFTVTDNNGCTTSSDVTLTEPQALSASTASTDLSCFQSCDGTGSVSVSGGTAPYVYQWDNSTFATTAAFTNECAGTYTVQVTDDNGCQLSETIVIGQPTAIAISANITNSNCGQDNGQVCANVNGGTAPYSYQWNDPNTQTGACALNLFAGCYTFTVTDANACVMDTLLCLNDIAGPTVTGVSSVDVTCAGAANGSVQFNSTGGSGTLTHEIVDGLGITVLTGATTASNLDGDCYTLITTDAAGCVASDVLCVNEPNALNAAVIQSTDVSCFQSCDGTALASANGGMTPYTYSWNGGTAPTQNNNTGLCAGNYTVTVTDVNNCSTTASITINEPTAITITESLTDVSCFGGGDGEIDITVAGGTPFYLYDWTPNASTIEDQTQLIAGTYSITITDANGCNENATYVINEPTQIVPVFDLFTDPTCELCNGEATVSATGGTGAYTYFWDSNNATTAANTGMCPGLQEVTITDANGCTMTIDQTMTNQASPAIDSITYVAPSCTGLTNGTATVYPSGIFDPNQMTYQWDAATNNQMTQTAVALGDGLYCVTVTDPNGCTASSCVDVIEPSPLSAVPDGATTICYGQDTQIWASGQGGTAPYTILWTPAGFTGQGPITVAPTTTTDYCFRVEDANGCLSTQECIEIIVREQLALDMSPSTSICDGSDVDITALATGGVPADYVFTWQDEFLNAVTATSVNDLSTATVSPAVPTWYYVTLSDGCSNEVTDSTQVSINALPVAFLSAVDSSGCEPFNAQFIANSDIGVTYEYDIDCDGVYESSGTNTTFNYTFDTEGTYDVCLNVISAEGCSTMVSNLDFIEVYPLPVADFTPDPSATTILTPEITFVDNSTGGYTYDWDFGDGFLMTGNPQTVYNGEENTTGPITLPIHTFNDTGYYDVTLLITTSYGCTSEHTETIFIEGDYTFYTPNAFSPNGDGDNDTFRPIGIGIDEDNYEFYIFNRWGQLIFEGYDPYDEWDGTYNNVMSQTDVYVWLIKTRDHEGNPKEYRGHVTLVK